MSDIAIKVENLSKIYKLYDRPQDRFKETFHPFRKKYHHDFYALKNISFEVRKGETLGIIGKNGAGKSTLLQIIYNVVSPSSGSIEVNGKVSALLELGAGFNPEFTGIENIFYNASIMGYTKAEIEDKLDEILAFADIGEFAGQPMKTYSTGMFVRLAFSVATTVEPDILILDEALSVGDFFFQAKCVDRIRSMIDQQGTTLLFVSHDLMTVKSICKKCILLDNGIIAEHGDSNDVVDKYYAMKIESEQNISADDLNRSINKAANRDENMSDKEYDIFKENQLFLQTASYQRIQNGKAEIVNVQLLNDKEEMVFAVEYEQDVVLRIAIEIHEDIPELVHGYAIRNEDGIEVVHSDSIIEGRNLRDVRKGEKYIIDWNFRAALTDQHGHYSVTTGLVIPVNYGKIQMEFCDRIPIAVQFMMQPRKHFPLMGFVHWKNDIDIRRL